MFTVDAERPVHVSYQINSDGQLQSVVLDRWGDPDETGTFGTRPFGGDFTSQATFEGVTVPDAGRFGWHCGTDQWTEGEFIRNHLTDLAPMTNPTS